MNKTVNDLLDSLRKEGVQLRTKERNSDKAVSKRRREARKGEAASRVAGREKARLRELRRYATLYGAWKMLRRAYRREARLGKANREFEISAEEWIILWLEAGDVTLGDGAPTPAWKLRGRSNTKDVILCRINDQRGFHLDNLMVRYRGATLADGRIIAKRLKKD